MNPKVTLICTKCDYQVRRAIYDLSGCRGIYETPSEPAHCIHGHGPMERKDRGPDPKPYGRHRYDSLTASGEPPAFTCWRCEHKIYTPSSTCKWCGTDNDLKDR